MPRHLDHCHLHAEADAEIRHLPQARVTSRLDLSFGAALAKTARHDDAVNVFEVRARIALLEKLGIEPIDIDADALAYAAMGQRFHQRLVGVFEVCVFSDDCDRDIPVRMGDAVRNLPPNIQGRFRRIVNAERRQNFVVEALRMIGKRNIINVVGIEGLDHGAFADVTE